MIIFTTRNYEGESIDFAEDCVEKYCKISRLSKKNPISKEKRPVVFKNQAGKPEVEGLYVSISHTKAKDTKILTVAVSNKSVGVDIEPYRDDIDWKKFAKRYFSKEENEVIKNKKDFFSKWTQKEAIYKAMKKQTGIFPPAIDTTLEKNLRTYYIYEDIILSVYTEDDNIYFYS